MLCASDDVIEALMVPDASGRIHDAIELVRAEGFPVVKFSAMDGYRGFRIEKRHIATYNKDVAKSRFQRFLWSTVCKQSGEYLFSAVS